MADLYRLVEEVEIEKTGAADESVLRLEDGGPGKARGQLERGFEPLLQIGGGLDPVAHVAPDAVVERYCLERGEVGAGERFQADFGAFEGGDLHGLFMTVQEQRQVQRQKQIPPLRS